MPASDTKQFSGLPSLPEFKFTTPSNLSVSPTNIFNLIKQGYGQQMSSVLPYVQQQLGVMGENIEPQIEAIRQRGESLAANAISDIGSRNLRGSDIEVAAVEGARAQAFQQEAQMRSQIAMQQAQMLAQSIMTAYGFDIKSNQEMFNNLAQAIGQELAQQREMQMFQQQMALLRKQIRSNRSSSIFGSLMGAVGSIGGGLMMGPLGSYLGTKLFSSSGNEG